jgi:hypothetical protein
MVIPTIKLAKAMFDNNLGDSAPAGYHVEALAVAAFENYTGPRDHSAMLTHLVSSASENVRRPIRDVTGQSPHVDADLGPANSSVRQARRTERRPRADIPVVPLVRLRRAALGLP